MKEFPIGKCRVMPARNMITCGEKSVSLEPKVMSVLVSLNDRRGEVVERITLLDEIWNDDEAADDSLTRAISLLRKALGGLDDTSHIETIPKRGYRLKRGVAGNAVESVDPIRSARPSIAVMPFSDLSPEANQGYFADGMAEEILNTLAHMPSVSVVGRTSSFAVETRRQTARQVGSILNVEYLLEGSLRLCGTRVRVTARLLSAEDGQPLWSEVYEGEIGDIFEFQGSIARAISSELSTHLGVADTTLPSARFTRNPDAYALFLQGRDLVHQLNGQTTIPSGIGLLEKAIAADPDFPDAHAWLALAHFILPEFTRTGDWEAHFPLSEQALERALALDPKCSMALLVKALQAAYRGRLDEAVAVAEEAVILDPNNIETMAGFGLCLMCIGLHDQARPYWERIVKQDPLCGIWHTTYGGLLLCAGEFEAAEAAFRRSFELGFGAAAFGVSHRMAERGEIDAAIAFMEANFDGLAPIEQAELRSSLKRRLVYKAYLEKSPLAKFTVGMGLKRRLANRRAQPTAASVIGFLFLGDAASYMRNVLEKPNPYVGYTIARIWEPTAESECIRNHPEFGAFAHRLGLPRAWSRYGWPHALATETSSGSGGITDGPLSSGQLAQMQS